MTPISRFLTLSVLLTTLLPGQVDRASLNGTVTDASGAIIPGAKIVAVARDTGIRRETATGSNGSYNIPGLPIGTYNVTVSAPGFETLEAGETCK